MAQDFFSNFSINEEVEFAPMYRHQQEMGIGSELLDGKVVSVRFTEAKVLYDIFNNYWGKVFDNVTSEKVFGLPEKINVAEKHI